VAAVSFDWYHKLFSVEEGGELVGDAFSIDYLSDTIKVALLTNAYTPNLGTHKVFSDLTNEVAAGGGYTAGGNARASKTLTPTEANSWATTRGNTTAYVAGDVVRPAAGNGFLYRCVAPGTTAGAPPAFSTTIGRETADGTVVWSALGTGITVWDAADPSWAGASFTARYGAIYKDTGTAGTSPLLWLATFAADVTSSGGTFLITLPNQLPGFACKAAA
jgi:hypothetical protein